MKLCGLIAVFSVIGVTAGSSEFVYAVFPIRQKVEYRVPLSNSGLGETRTLSELSLCGWVVHSVVYVNQDSSVVTVGDQGQFRLILTQDNAYIDVAGRRSEKIDLVQPTDWYHICVTWASVRGQYRIYVNGILQLSGSDLAAGELLEDITSLTIGNSTDSYVFAGRASYVQLYSRVLNQSEVEEESCSERCAACTRSLILSWNEIAAQISRTHSVYNDEESPIYLPPPPGLRVELLRDPHSIRAMWSTNPFSRQFQWYNIKISPSNRLPAQQIVYTTVKELIIIKDLSEDTLYSVRVSTQSRCGSETWSKPASIRTRAVPDPVGDLQVLGTTNSTVTVSWSSSEDDVGHYRSVIFATGDGSTQRHKTLPPTSLNYTFSGLSPNTWYTVKIASYSDLGIGEYSVVTALTPSNPAPDVDVTINIEILPEFEVAVSWDVSADPSESSFLYKLTIKKLSDKLKRTSYSKQLPDSGAEFKVDGKNTPFIEIKTSLRALTVKGLVPYAPYHVTVAICPDPTSLCLLTSHVNKIYVAQAEQHYYQQFFSGGPISHKIVQDMVQHVTQNSSFITHFTVTDISRTSFLGKLTFSNQEDGRNLTQGEMWYTLYRAQGTTFQNLLLGSSFQLSPVRPSGYCDYLKEEKQGRGNFTWPYAREHTVTTLPCNLNHPNLTEVRSRKCGVGGWEEEADYTLCPYTESASGDIQRLLDTPITNVEQAVEVSKKLTEVTAGAMTTEAIGMASQAISQIVSSGGNPSISFSVDVATNLAGALGNIQSLDRGKLAAEETALAAQHIVTDVEAYCQNLTGTDSTLVNYASPDLKLAVVKLPSGVDSDIFIESSAGTDSEMSVGYKKKVQSEDLLGGISVNIPQKLITPESNVLAVIYKDKSMFSANNQVLSGDDFDIPILSLSVNTVKKDSELAEEVEFGLTLNSTGRGKPVCVYWNTVDKSWSSEGVVMVYSDDKSILCKTTHLTSFSAILLPAQDDYILSIISQIGASISIICLFSTVLLLYIVRCVRECLSTKIHINFALALFLALLFFMINTSTTYPGTYCKVMAGMTHYFFLTAFCWMSVEAVGLYRAVVLVFTSASNKTFLIGASVIAWGLPALAVITLLSLKENVYQIHTNLNVCWLSRDWMYGTFFSPLLIMLLFNCLVFFRVLFTVIRNKHSRTKGTMKPGQRLVELRIILSIMTLLGLTWIFGVIQISYPHIVLEYLFALTNTLQGVAVFVFYCLYNPSIRLALWRVAHGKSINESASNSSSHQKKKKKRLSIRQATRQKISIVKAHIDGNPFAFTTTEGGPTLRKMDRKNWKKLKKHDIKHTNAQLADPINPRGATVLCSTGPSSITMPATALTTCYSVSREPSPEFQEIPPTHDDVTATKVREVTSENDVSLEKIVMLELDKDDVVLRGSSEQCSTSVESRPESRCSRPESRCSRPESRCSRPESRCSRPESRCSRPESRCSDSSRELDQSQSSSYEKLEEEEEKAATISNSCGLTV